MCVVGGMAGTTGKIGIAIFGLLRTLGPLALLCFVVVGEVGLTEEATG